MIQYRISAAPKRLFSSSFVFALALAGCAHQSDVSPAAPQAPGNPTPPANVIVESTSPAAPAPAANAEPAAATTPSVEPPMVLKDLGILTPESALYDPEQDVYFVSSVNGTPDVVDGNGFISKVSPDGKVLDLKWVDGTKKESALNAPKGLAVSGNLLYVADLTFIRMFDRKTGAPKGKIAIPGATFLNDVTTGPDGTVYVSDSGIKFGKEGPEPTGTDAVYKLGKGNKVEKLFTDKEGTHPNGLVVDDTGVWVVTFGSGELYRIGKDGKKDAAQKLPSGALDGIVKLSDGTLLISSWAASAVYRGTPGGTFEVAIADMKSPADIGYDTKRDVVLIPQMQLNTLVLQKLPGGPPAPAAKDAPPAPVSSPSAPPAPAPAANAKPAAPATAVEAKTAEAKAAPPGTATLASKTDSATPLVKK